MKGRLRRVKELPMLGLVHEKKPRTETRKEKKEKKNGRAK